MQRKEYSRVPRGGKRAGAGRKKSIRTESILSSSNAIQIEGKGSGVHEKIESISEIKDSNQNEPKEIIKEESKDSIENGLLTPLPEREQLREIIESTPRKKARFKPDRKPKDKQSLGQNSSSSSGIPSELHEEIARNNSNVLHSIGTGISSEQYSQDHAATLSEASTRDSNQRPEQQYGNASRVVELTDERVRILREAISDPVRWGEWLFEQKLDDWQCDAARAFVKGERISRAVCNGGGKTRLFAVLGSWLLASFRDSKVVMTAGVFRQCMVMKDELFRVMPKLTGWTLKEQELVHTRGTKFMWFAADNPGFFEGHHAAHIALLIDEAKSVESGIYQASERLTANNKRYTMVASSPGGAVGWFYDTFTSKREFWNSKHVSAIDIQRIPRGQIEEIKRMHGEESSLYKSMILAQFTESVEGSLIKLEWVNNCIQSPSYFRGGEKVAGLDPAGGGDDNVIVIREGNRINEIIAWKDKDTMRTAGRFVAELRERKIPCQNVYADAGGVGQGILDKMAELDFVAHRIHFGGSPIYKTEVISNRMTELWVNMKEQIESRKVILPNDDKLIAQLSSRLCTVRSSGKIHLESKEEMRRRGLPSPDRADALALALLPATIKPKSMTIIDKQNNMTYGDQDNPVGVSANGAFEFGN